MPISYSTGEKRSFGWVTARERWPVIITQAIDDLYRSVSDSEDGEKKTEGKAVTEKIARLKYEAQHDRPLTPIDDDGQPDVKLYNDELASLGEPTWLNTPWLFCECYLFRRISTYFKLSTHWKNYDVFARQKINTFRSSRPAVLELAARFKGLVQQLEANGSATQDEEAGKLLFAEMCEICLWGNATDLSLLTSLTYEDIQKLQGSEARKASEKNILANDLPAAYAVLQKAVAEGKKERRVDIVLDNAGFELYVDLILAGYLLSAGLATHIVLHPKSIPWFVSDVLPGDFAALLGAIASPKRFYETPSAEEELQGKTPEPLSDADQQSLAFLFGELTKYHAEGQLLLRPNRFWTHAGNFWRLPEEAPELYEDLKGSELVVFKGDLNYRKLTGDADWDPTTPFPEAIKTLGPGSGLNVLALRTCKADVVVGLPAGKDEELRALEGGGGDSGARKWAWNGKWAVVSFSQGK
ncbi:Damage-control phosphatase like protein [Verticillium longisporum]|uniref:Sugar phosphate phosphatase n=1 Tax=Verticillium longisporum TaxID=100787 RepID=A0A8I2ZAI8_VERLO|nr:Damage-control phosphatase like protein [Verticillium longisporum]KAG7124949.1 Damage-control phosphatase like protein [Verticillium longisporum]